VNQPEFLEYCKTILSNFGLAGVNVSFTSPPYFDREKYSKEPVTVQLDVSRIPSMENEIPEGYDCNVHELLIPGGKFYLNISNTYESDGTINPMEQDTVTFFTESGMKPVKTYKMVLSGSSKSVNRVEVGVPHKFEPVFVFEK